MMPLKNTQQTYGSISRFLHWLLMPLVLFLLLLGATLGYSPTTFKTFMLSTHKLMGLSALLLIFIFSLWSCINPKPSYPAHMKAKEKMLAKMIRLLLYLCVFTITLTGWAKATATGHPPTLWGQIRLPMPGIDINHELSTLLGQLHQATAWVLLTAIVLHVFGAAWHFFICKDKLVQRMLCRTKSFH